MAVLGSFVGGDKSVTVLGDTVDVRVEFNARRVETLGQEHIVELARRGAVRSVKCLTSSGGTLCEFDVVGFSLVINGRRIDVMTDGDLDLTDEVVALLAGEVTPEEFVDAVVNTLKSYLCDGIEAFLQRRNAE